MEFLHIDTINGATYNTDSTNSTFQIVPGSQAYSPNDYNVLVPLSKPIQNINRIFLKSFSTVLLFPNVRASSLLNFVNINCDGTIKKIVLADKIYTNITSLIADLNVASTYLFASDNIVFSINQFSGTIAVTSTTHTSVLVQDSNLAYLLGFRSSININSTNNCVAPYLYNLALDTYLNMYIANVPTGNQPNSNRINCSFKIPINSGSYAVNFTCESLNYSEYIKINNTHVPITSLNIIISDRLGFSIPSWGASFSCTFALEPKSYLL
jgi:hypothetical protein